MTELVQNITLEQVAALLVFVGGLYGGVKYLKKELKEGLVEMLNGPFSDVDKKLDNDKKRIDQLEKDIRYIKQTQTQTLKALLVILDELKKNNDVDGTIKDVENDMQDFLIER